ncbi:MAG: DUF4405 domain-containing protein [Candidatus Aminicenantes bacterium]|nr:DUF4405 domain-containing protein [Candidatus Aminicenantes bacterium]
MKKSDWQYLVDTLLFICMFGIAFIGILMGFFLAEGPTVRESEKYFLGLHRHQWGDIHLYLSLAFVLLIVIHLMLAWSWIKGKSQALFKKRWGTIISLTVLISALVVFLFWIFTPKYPLIYENYGMGARAKSQGQLSPEEFIYERQGYVTITGNMTLAEVEKFTGIPAKTLAEKLGLPPKTSPEETFGLLRKRYGFSLLEARDAITTLLQRTPATPKEALVPEETPLPQEAPVSKEEIQARPLYLEEKKDEHEEEPKITRGRLSEDQSGVLITGRMTLYEIGRQTGISAREIASKLGLPHNVSMNESIGRLRRRYGFTIQDLRDVIASLMETK